MGTIYICVCYDHKEFVDLDKMPSVSGVVHGDDAYNKMLSEKDDWGYEAYWGMMLTSFLRSHTKCRIGIVNDLEEDFYSITNGKPDSDGEVWKLWERDL